MYDYDRRFATNLASRLFVFLDAALNIAHGTKKGVLEDALKEASAAIKKADVYQLSIMDVKDLGGYVRKYLPKKRFTSEEQRAIKELNDALVDLAKRKTQGVVER